jgi:aspartate aminotransferase
VHGRQELEAVATVARRHNLTVLSDEIYEKILFDGREHVSMAALPGMRERTVTVNGFSKGYAMTGWRLGYLAAEARLAEELNKVQQHTVGCAGSFVQTAAVQALLGTQEPVEAMRQEYQARRDLVVAGLNSLPGVRCHAPEGTFYAFPDVSACGFPSSTAFAEHLLSEAHVALTPGEAFGACGDGYIRISFATSRETIEKGISRIGEALKQGAAR